MKDQKNKNDILLNSAIEQKLKLSYEQRIAAHEKARKLYHDLKLAGEKQRARSKQAS